MQVVHQVEREKPTLSPLDSATLKCLVYFDLFMYPLTLPEIYRFMETKPAGMPALKDSLDRLAGRFIVFQFGAFYSLRNDYSLVVRREEGNREATRIWPKAKRMAARIHQFPFVRSVNISGSLSKNYFDPSSDIDFFIITKPGRIWLCRTLLALYKKLFLLNSRKYFCINYFITTDSLTIPDQNLFAATELVTLCNLTGAGPYHQFLLENRWVSTYFPQFEVGEKQPEPYADKRRKQWLEWMFSGFAGVFLDRVGYEITLRFWKIKFRHMRADEFAHNLRSGRHVSKHHPQGFQFKVLKGIEEACRQLEEKHQFRFYG